MPRTKEQQEYVDSLIGTKKVPKKTYRKRWTYSVPVETKKTDYMRNCIYWIEEYEARRSDLERLKNAFKALRVHIGDLEQEYGC